MFLCIFFILFFAAITFSTWFMAVNLWKDIKDPYKSYDNMVAPYILIGVTSLMGCLVFLATGYYLLEFVKMVSK